MIKTNHNMKIKQGKKDIMYYQYLVGLKEREINNLYLHVRNLQLELQNKQLLNELTLKELLKPTRIKIDDKVLDELKKEIEEQ